MTAHLIIQKRHGALTWCIGYDMAGRTTKLDPVPIAQVLLTEADLALGGRALFDRWIRENVPTKPIPEAPAPTVARQPPLSPAIADEIHIPAGAPDPVRLPDGREIAVGDGLTIITTHRFADLVEAARFGMSEGSI